MDDDIVITAVIVDDTDPWESLMGICRFYTPKQVDEGGGGSGGSDGDLYSALQNFFEFILEKIFDRAVETEQEKRDRESRISTQFNPANVVTTGSYTTASGKTGKTWTMNDGTQYWDTNGNGQPDYQTRFDGAGHLYGFNGSGWTQLN